MLTEMRNTASEQQMRKEWEFQQLAHPATPTTAFTVASFAGTLPVHQ
jgi:hypothetical protein